MLLGTVKQTHGLLPLLHPHIGLSKVETAEGFEGEGVGSVLLLYGQVLLNTRNVSKVRDVLEDI